MKIAISGYGKMGREIEKIAHARGHQVVATIDRPEDWDTARQKIIQADVVMEFSTPATVVENIRKSFDLGLPVVAGTTGWNQHASMVKEWCTGEGRAIFTAANFSLGVNILFRLTRELAGMLDHLEAYDISLEEVHHIHKMDAPSGTAIRLAEIILEQTGRKEKWVNREAVDPTELSVISRREGEIFGTHTLKCNSDSDTLTLRHEALNRKGFALGAVMAAEWLQGKIGCFGMDDMLRF